MVPKSPKGILLFTLKIIVVWILTSFLFQFIRTFGIEEMPYIEVTKKFNIGQIITLSLMIGSICGIFYSGIEILFNKPFFQKLALGRLLLLKTLIYFLLVRLLFLFIVVFIGTQWENQSLNSQFIMETIRGKSFWVILVYFLVVSTMITFILIVSQKFGPGMLWKFLIGKYHHPKEEERIFLFIDLKSSTTIAENLGHLNFSNLIQDCFFDLTDVIVQHQVDIYQYVGDEAVLSWEKARGVKDQRCIHAYFDFMKILNDRGEYYQNKYGVKPFFKAGLHFGTVMAAEVGVIKKEIAYHGDVLNTTARIQGECNTYNQSLLASEDIINDMDINAPFTKEFVGEPVLKGKENRIKIYGIQSVSVVDGR
ncbi:adenylate/guanylate cyclase domain-containing protein [bacterium]|nr:adenylate/guanylate cyclase domain-containing protein [bacterium]